MEFFWWAWTAQPEWFAVLGADCQVERHVKAIAEAVKKGDGLTRQRLELALTAVTLLASHGVLGTVLGGVLGDTDDLRTTYEIFRSIPDVLQTKFGLRDKARQRNSGTVFSVTARSQAQDAARNDARWLGLTANLVPLLIAVEDAQFLDQVSIELLQELCRQPGAAGLVVLTVDTDQPSATGRIADWLKAGDWAERLTSIRLSPLSAAELAEIAVRALGTELDRGNLARVIRHAAGVPGTLYGLLETPAVAKMLREGGTGRADLGATSIAQGVRAAFSAAKAPLRQLLAATSVHGPMTVREWLPGAGAPALVDEAIEAGWLLPRPGTGVVSFASSHLLDAVRAEQNRELVPAAILVLRQDLVRAIEQAHADGSWDYLDADVCESLLATVVEEDPEPPVSMTAELFDLRRASGRAAADADLLDEITERLASDQPRPRVLVVATAEALFDAGRMDQAFRLLSDDLERIRSQYGHDDPRTRPALHNLAAAYAAAARTSHGQPNAASLYQTALVLYEELLEARVHARPADLEQIIGTRNQYARLLAECYRYREAMTQGEILVREQQAALGPDHPDVIVTRAQLASWQLDSGDPAGAIGVLEQVIPILERVLGPSDTRTFNARANLAVAVGDAVDPAHAASALEQIVSDANVALGPYHPFTLIARSHHAHYRDKAGDTTGALMALGGLLPDCVAALHAGQ